jgi:hypothetical protein
VDVIDEANIPDQFVEIVTTRKIDKTAIKKSF